jgi:hypothetical protein
MFGGHAYLKSVKAQMEKNMAAALIHFAGAVQRKISRTQPRKRYSGKYVSYKGLDPSSPGSPPKILSAELVRSIAWEIDPDGLSGRVGSGMKYATFLELGTSRMASRPFFDPVLFEESSRLEDILTVMPK